MRVCWVAPRPALGSAHAIAGDEAVALKSTVFRAELTISDLDREFYETFSLTLARHPSETDERMMIRLLAFALEADERLAFGGGLSTDDEPDLWRKGLDGTIERWIEVGLPDPKRLKQAMGRSAAVRVVTYGGAKLGHWWQKHGAELRAFGNDFELLDVMQRSLAYNAASSVCEEGSSVSAIACRESGRFGKCHRVDWRGRQDDRSASPHW